MKVWKNPFVKYPYYFIKTGKASTGKNEATASNGYAVYNLNGNQECEKVSFYNFTLKDEMPIVAESKESIGCIIKRAVIMAVLNAVEEVENSENMD